MAIEAISAKLNKELEDKYNEACSRAIMEHDRASRLVRQLDDANKKIAEIEIKTCDIAAHKEIERLKDIIKNLKIEVKGS
jgi:hypothetical protein